VNWRAEDDDRENVEPSLSFDCIVQSERIIARFGEFFGEATEEIATEPVERDSAFHPTISARSRSQRSGISPLPSGLFS
jgi:hypothetical protein